MLPGQNSEALTVPASPYMDEAEPPSPSLNLVESPEVAATETRQAVRTNLVNLNDRLLKTCAKGTPEEIDQLIEKGANPNYPADNWTPLKRAIVADNLKGVQTLLNKKETRLDQVDQWGITELMMAVGRRNADMLHLLLENGADANRKDMSGRTALALSEELGFDDMAEILRPVIAEEKKN